MSEDLAEAEEDVLPKKESKIPQQPIAPDGGWGWVVVVGCVLMHFIMGGINRSYGILYSVLIERYGSSAALTALVGSLANSLRFGLSPISTGLCAKFGTRPVVIVGACFISLGLFACAFNTNIYLWFFTYSLLAGIGGSLIYTPSLVIVNQYFDRRQSTATGLSSGGSGFGAFIFPPLLTFAFSYYGYIGAILLLSAMSLHFFIVGAVYRPLKSQAPQKKLIDLQLFREPLFVLTSLSLALHVVSYMSAQMFIIDKAVLHGITHQQASYVLSLYGLCDMLGRVISGFLFDLHRLRSKRSRIFIASMCLSGVTIAVWGWVQSLWCLLLVALLSGLSTGVCIGQRLVIVADIVGRARLNQSFGLSVFVFGIAVTAGPPLAGLFFDVFKNYQLSFTFAGGSAVLGSMVLATAFLVYGERLKLKDETTGSD